MQASIKPKESEAKGVQRSLQRAYSKLLAEDNDGASILLKLAYNELCLMLNVAPIEGNIQLSRNNRDQVLRIVKDMQRAVAVIEREDFGWVPLSMTKMETVIYRIERTFSHITEWEKLVCIRNREIDNGGIEGVGFNTDDTD
jgi:hypothetical protein